MMTHDEMIAAIQAHKDGKQIQHRCIGHDGCDTWYDSKPPLWNFVSFDYRVKPEPKIRPWTREEAEKHIGAVMVGDGWRAQILCADDSSVLFAYRDCEVLRYSFERLASHGIRVKWPRESDSSLKPCGVEE